MPSLPLQPRYGPTAGQRLARRWRAAGSLGRAAAAFGAALALAGLVGGVLTLLPNHYSRGGAVPFGFSYRGLDRTAAGPGEYVRLVKRSGGELAASYAVAPVRLAPYSGSWNAALPLYVAAYERRLAARLAGFRLEGEGKTHITSSLGGYQLLYSAQIGTRRMWGRDIVLMPGRDGERDGVVVQMLSNEPATVSKPVGSSGVLERPLKTFSFG